MFVDPEKINPARFPKKLSHVSPKMSKITTRAGMQDDDPSDDVVDVTHVPEGFPVRHEVRSMFPASPARILCVYA